MKTPVTLAILGAGKRGAGYADYALAHSDEACVIAVAEPRAYQQQALARAHNVAADHVFDSWQSFARSSVKVDAVLIATQDRDHLAPVEALAPRGCAILLEKPMSPSLEDCERIVACVKRHKNIFAVCHVSFTPL